MGTLGRGLATADAKLCEITGRLERLPFTSYQVQLFCYVGVALAFDAFDALAIAFSLPALVGLWHITHEQVGLLISSGYVGQLFGSVILGWVADRFGRIRAIYLATIIFAGMSVFCATSWSYESLFIFRMIQGLGLGGLSPLAATYVTEVAKAKKRGLYFVAFYMLFPIGLLAGSFASFWIMDNLGWRWLYVLGGLPIILAIFLPWLAPESPRWLASVGQIDKAERAMTHIEEMVRRRYKADLPAWKPDRLPPSTGARPGLRDLFRGRYKARTISAWVIFFSTYLITYGINTWLPTIYKTVYKFSEHRAMLYGVIVFIAGFIGSLVCGLLIDKVGRRAWIGIVLCIGGPVLGVLWLLGARTAQEVLIWTALSYLFISSASIAAVLYAQEIYPTSMRAWGANVASCWIRIAAIVGPIVVGAIITHSNLSWAFLLFGCAALIGGVVTLLFGTETRGRVLEDVSP